MKVLGIETSCDETAAAVVEDGKTVLSSIVATQIDIHHQYGGVVPELASRNHIKSIVTVVDEAISAAGITKDEIDGVSATQGPGLVGALLVGLTFGKSFAFGRKIPFIGVNHLEGHISSVFLNEKTPSFPYVALLVSGGHTSIYYIKSHTDYELMGQTRDDAVGEAYDKISKMLGFGYPGGKVIDDLSKKGDRKKIRFPRTYLDKNGFDFSFSGLKTSVNRYITDNDNLENEISDIAAGFQEAIVEVLTYKIINAAKVKNCKDIAVVGGVAANSRLREEVKKSADKKGLNLFIPDLKYCGDNGAMIAAIGYQYLNSGASSDPDCDVYSRPKVTSGKKHK